MKDGRRADETTDNRAGSSIINITSEDANALVHFFRLAMGLKRVKRQGWIDRGVVDPESSADHSWSVALHAWLLAHEQDDLDPDRVLLLALVHDLPEALAGDATPFDLHRDERGEIASEHFQNAPAYDTAETRAKHQRERDALREMTTGLPAELALRLSETWEDYNTGTSAEARFVRQVDKLETLLQAELYREDQSEIVIESFRAGTYRDVTDPGLRRILSHIRTDGAMIDGSDKQSEAKDGQHRRNHGPEPDDPDR